ncbi:hypothetical protein [Metabacillus litoralis]|uniref:hypothetical protein n=1 Tax=Metabacillus litoralis TaxID=152268 RepID=UPI001CFF5229|nr:hypothetical protein [Metabacillus litoralis]
MQNMKKIKVALLSLLLVFSSFTATILTVNAEVLWRTCSLYANKEGDCSNYLSKRDLKSNWYVTSKVHNLYKTNSSNDIYMKAITYTHASADYRGSGNQTVENGPYYKGGWVITSSGGTTYLNSSWLFLGNNPTFSRTINKWDYDGDVDSTVSVMGGTASSCYAGSCTEFKQATELTR